MHAFLFVKSSHTFYDLLKEVFGDDLRETLERIKEPLEATSIGKFLHHIVVVLCLDELVHPDNVIAV
jgi:hypothetical protein